MREELKAFLEGSRDGFMRVTLFALCFPALVVIAVVGSITVLFADLSEPAYRLMVTLMRIEHKIFDFVMGRRR